MLRQSIIILFAIFALSVNANEDLKENPLDQFILNQIEILDLELELFGTPNTKIIDISSIKLYEIEEEVVFNFNTMNYLPKGFDARKGMEDIDWDTINLYEVEEDIDLGFDTKEYLPKGFNPYQGMIKENLTYQFSEEQVEILALQVKLFDISNNDIMDVSSIKLYEIEEDVFFNFDTMSYLPKDFNAKKGMEYIDWNIIELYEVEEEIYLGFDTKKYLPKDFNPYLGMTKVKSRGVCLF